MSNLDKTVLGKIAEQMIEREELLKDLHEFLRLQTTNQGTQMYEWKSDTKVLMARIEGLVQINENQQ